MHAYSLSHLSDSDVLRSAAEYNSQERGSAAMLIAHIAEIEARRLYLPAGYPSTFEYCVRELKLSEDSALKRLQVAMAARNFPVLFSALADGRIHLTGARLIAPHLTAENVGEVLAAATHRRKSEIEEMVVARFGSSERARPMTSITPVKVLHAPGHVIPTLLDSVAEPAPASTDEPQAEEPVQEPPAPPPVCFKLQVVIEKSTHDKLRHLQGLLSHALPSGDVAQVLDRSFDALIAQLERRKFAATAKARRTGPSSADPRHIPAHVKRAVRERDQGQCTFVSNTGHRCGARKFIEYDHIDPVARGGQSTVDNLRLRCRAHNQYEAERVFGESFMDQKREAARSAVVSRAQAPAVESRARAEAGEARACSAEEHSKDIIAGLRELGFRADQARRAAEYCATLHNATLEARMRAALKFLCPKRSHPPNALAHQNHRL